MLLAWKKLEKRRQKATQVAQLPLAPPLQAEGKETNVQTYLLHLQWRKQCTRLVVSLNSDNFPILQIKKQHRGSGAFVILSLL